MDMFIKIKIGSRLEEQFYFMSIEIGRIIIELKTRTVMNNHPIEKFNGFLGVTWMCSSKLKLVALLKNNSTSCHKNGETNYRKIKIGAFINNNCS
jgi:hypothetical protein